MRRLILALGLLLATPAIAWETPERGSQIRADMLDALRPHVEWSLGAPVEFVVHDIRLEGDAGFLSLMAQRPGGGAIDLYTSPAALRGELDPSVGDGATIQALLQKSGRVWVATHHAIGATDVWWAWGAFCPVWGGVVPEACTN